MAGDLFHFESFKGGRNVVLSDVVRRGFLGKIVEDILRQPRHQVFGHVTVVMGVGTGPVAFYRHTPASIQTGQVGRLSPSGEPFGVSAEEQRPTART